ncbi:hypothetical protein [Burkholderia sp. PU8-34]
MKGAATFGDPTRGSPVPPATLRWRHATHDLGMTVARPSQVRRHAPRIRLCTHRPRAFVVPATGVDHASDVPITPTTHLDTQKQTGQRRYFAACLPHGLRAGKNAVSRGNRAAAIAARATIDGRPGFFCMTNRDTRRARRE